MVQLIEKPSTPKVKKSDMAKVKTPAQTPKAVAMKAKNRSGTPQKTPKTPKLEKTPKMIKAIQMEETPKAKKSPKVANTPKVKSEPETPQLDKTPKAKKSPKILKTPKLEVNPEPESISQMEETPKAKKSPKTPKLEIKAEPESPSKMQDTPKQEKESKRETPKVKVESETEESAKVVKSSKKSKKRKASAIAESEPMETDDAQSSTAKKQKTKNQDKNTVFVGKLNWSASEDEVQNLFSKYGNVTSVRLGKPHKPGQKNGGFAFVSFSDKAEYEAAIASENTHNGKPLFVGPVTPKDQTKRKSADSNDHPSKRSAIEDDHEIFVGGLPSTSEDSTLEKYFSQFGQVDSVSMPLAKSDKKFAFVRFVEKDTLPKVFAQKDHEFEGSQIRVRAKMVSKEVAKKQDRKNLVKSFEIRVVGLANNLTSDDVKDHFKQFGTISSLTLPTDRNTKKNKGFAFIAFSSEEEMQAAAALKYHTISGKKTTCVVNKTLGESKQTAKPNLTRQFEVRVKGLDYGTTSQDLQEHFGEFGKISNITLPLDKNTGQNRGFAFVAFTNAAEVQAVFKQKKHKIGPNVVTCFRNEAVDSSSTMETSSKKGNKEVKSESEDADDDDDDAEDDDDDAEEDDEDDNDAEDDDDDDAEEGDDDDDAEEGDDDDDAEEDDDDDDAEDDDDDE